MLANFNPQQVFFIAILVIAIILFLTEWIRNDVVAVLIVMWEAGMKPGFCFCSLG